MRKQKQIVCFILILCGFVCARQTVDAQNSKVDSVFLLLQQCNQPKGVDTAKFSKAMNLLVQSDFTIEQLQQLESSIGKFQGKEKYYGDFTKYTILSWNKLNDYQKSIEYGKKLVEEWRLSADPDLKLLADFSLNQMRLFYRNSGKVVEGVKYYLQKLQDYKQEKYNNGIATCYYVLGGFYRYMGLLNQAIFSMKRSLNYIDSSNAKPVYFKEIQLNTQGERGRWYNNNSVVANYYFYNGEYKQAEKYARYNYLSKVNTSTSHQPIKTIGLVKVYNGEMDSAFFYLSKVNISSMTTNSKADMYQTMCFYYLRKGDLIRAESYADTLYKLVDKGKIPADANTGIIHPDYYLALIRIEQKKYAEAIRLLEKDNIRLVKSRRELLTNYLLLADLYAKINNDKLSRENYLKYIELQKTIQNDQQAFEEAGFEMEMQLAKNEDTINQLEIQNKVNAATRNYVVAFALLLLLLIGMIYFRYRSKKRANEVLENTIQKLQTTQQQLVQAEKMASLGELTAGIAHEIQNPLNFVNNFSEINTELLEELEVALSKNQIQEVTSLAKDIRENESKINHHGKRADSIVKGMLQHSRKSAGQKELTDINVLCEEYLRLAYHGLRAKDKTFNAHFEMKPDMNLPNIMLMQQEMGRVILNLINNAFYAVNERKKKEDAAFIPSVIVRTLTDGKAVTILVEDNGSGIPEPVQQKIFQPFFTTKPTGEGTGLGLSLSYDIIKAHGGTISLQSKEGEGTRFSINLPIA